MDILTLELFEVTVSTALRELNRAVEQHPALPLRVLLGADPMVQHNVQRYLDRLGRKADFHREAGGWRVDVAAAAPPAPEPLPPAAPTAAPAPTPAPAFRAGRRPLLLTRSHLGQDNPAMGRRLLLGILRQLDPAVPWLGLALDGLDLLDDPEAAAVLQELQGRGIPVRISRESLLFPPDPGSGFEVMEDALWQRLAGRGELTLL